MKEVIKNIYNVGVNDYNVDLFEGQYPVKNGMAYNSYILKGEKTAVTDSVDGHFAKEWLKNVEEVLGDATPDYIVVHHMEPDHSGSLKAFLEKYPETTVVGNDKIFVMISEFFPELTIKNKLSVKEGDKLDLGGFTLNFVFAPMVHWPEVMMSYEEETKTLFSADAFGKFGAVENDEVDIDEWKEEGRRYYIGIVGKYGVQVQGVLKKAGALDIKTICPLHGPVLKENLGCYIGLYDTWSKYSPEQKGVLVAYTSVYGHTREAALLLKEEIEKLGVKAEAVDLARTDVSFAVAKAFEYSATAFATTTYNGNIFPFMRNFIESLVERGFKARKVGFIENGSWAPVATRIMKTMFEKSTLDYASTDVKIRSALSKETKDSVKSLARELAE